MDQDLNDARSQPWENQREEVLQVERTASSEDLQMRWAGLVLRRERKQIT